MTILSIVTGTYNRISYLHDMVESIRKSALNLSYEIIVVDGGSRDGTQDWCRKQPDIRLIEHGKLLGAVKAFNDGARAAVGKYVILANDDIKFIDESLLAAYSFMEDNPRVGVGCFWQDRYKQGWHVERMSATTYDGRHTVVFYGQVCIVPRELGNKVGWWGNYLRTYGGDNELSCNIIELGYEIKPIPCACIHDDSPMDELRRINNPDGIQNPDSTKWIQKWTRNGKLGPRLPAIWKSRNYTRELRIVYAPIYEQAYPIQKIQKRGLREALSRVASVIEIDYAKLSLDYVHDVGLYFKPDIFLLQLHNPVSVDTIYAMKREFPNSLLVNWNGDYHPETLFSKDYVGFLRLFDLTGLVTTSIDSLYKENSIKHFYWQIGYEDSSAMPNNVTPKHDVLFMGNSYSKDRYVFGKFLRSLPYNVGLYGAWASELKANGSTLYNFDEGAKLYRNCKIAISDSQWPNATGFVSNRLFQSMSAGAFLLQQHFDGLGELLGLKDGYHLSVWKTYDDLRDRIDFFMKHSLERNHIARNGTKFIRENHSFDARVRELLYELKKRGSDYTSVYNHR